MKLSKLLTVLIALTLCGALSLLLSSSPAEQTTTPSRKKPALSGKVNINTATLEQLEMLPRIGTKTAQSIIEYRTQNELFEKAEDLTKVRGIGEKTVEELQKFIILQGTTTLKNTP
jgi:competence protein ComEA